VDIYLDLLGKRYRRIHESEENDKDDNNNEKKRGDVRYSAAMEWLVGSTLVLELIIRIASGSARSESSEEKEKRSVDVARSEAAEEQEKKQQQDPPPRTLPGPASLPLIGSTSLIGATINNKVVEELVSLRREHGPIFLAKTGPVTQVWVDDAEMVNELFSMESATGRSQLKKPVFGGDFLFLVRDVERARKIRSNQKALLGERSSSPSVLAAVDSSNLSVIISEQLDQSNSEGAVSWPSKRIASASFNALVFLYVGCHPLTADEVDRLLRAVAGYRRRGIPNFVEVIARTFGVSKKLSFTDEINGLLSEVVSRANVSPELLPLLVSALNFLASSIATLVRDFEWEPVAGDGIKRMFEIEGDGSLLVPKHDTLLKFSKR